MSQGDEVRDFYERMPYPAPVAQLDDNQPLDAGRRRAEFHLVWPDLPPSDEQTILIAGCGTSQAARYARRQPAARVVAIDVSDTSLRHTRELKDRHHLDNLELHQLSIERVQDLSLAFDLVVCTGVLHHLPDPDRGLRALREVLNPLGAMRLMVYARYGRAGIYMLQEYCRLLGVDASAAELRDLRAALDVLPADHPIAGTLRQAKDFRTPDAMADALLHPLDRAFTVPEVYDWLERCGMSFGRWIEQAPYLPRCGAVARSPHAARLATLPPRLQHAAVELFRGTMVAHSLIAYRDDRPAGSQPISFAGDRWPDYVPLARPMTVCVRDHPPAGSVAVLINRGHTFTDLLCTIDALEMRLLGAVDGQRTLADVVARAGDGDSRRVITFFERLWDYDQVVFDASRGGH